MDKIKKLIKKFCTKEIIFYVIFGVFTTIVNVGSFYVMNKIWDWNEDLSNFIAIVLAVLFAYVTNKDLVFHSDAKNFKEKLNQFLKFILGRAFTMIVEFGGWFVLFKTAIPEMISKCFMTVIVIILNFFISKFFAFKKKDKLGDINEESNNNNTSI
mgnify:FL=1